MLRQQQALVFALLQELLCVPLAWHDGAVLHQSMHQLQHTLVFFQL